jgi:hypothetical protein
VLGNPLARLAGCSSDWKSTAFGTQESLVQIQSPRLFRLFVRAALVRAAFVGAVLVIVGIPVAHAADRVARGTSVVVREGPAPNRPAVAVLERSERARFLGERDGWSEIGLSDGSRGWVPSVEIVAVTDPITSPAITASPVADGERRANEGGSGEIGALRDEVANSQAHERAALDDLRNELRRVREALDRLALPAGTPTAATTRDPRWPPAELLLAGGAALVVGFVLGAASQRRRARRERSLRF